MDIEKNINTALGKRKAELVLKNAYIINVFDQSIEKNDIAVSDGIIAGIGKYNGEKEIDCTGKFVAPGFIDSHVHIESSMVTPEIFSQIVLKKGVTAAIADPHEIANVLGIDGIKFMIENSKKSVMDLFFMLPSCVPATAYEDNGAVLNAEDLSALIDNEKVLGLGEVMDVPSVAGCDEEMLKKLTMFRNKNIDGHSPRISDKILNAYTGCGVKTDHECVSYEEAVKKVQRGMYVMLREGSAARNLKDLLPAVDIDNFHRFLFCTDDRHIEDIMDEGTIDNCIRLAIKEGLDPLKALTIATYNAALCYNLRDRGAVAPGYKADLVIFDDLKKINIIKVIKDGRIFDNSMKYSKVEMNTSMNIDYITKDKFRVEAKSDFINVIKLISHSIETKRERKKIIREDNFVKAVEGDDVLKIGVFERHKNTGRYAIGFISGLGLKNCAIAQTIAHDSHNIIVVGDNDKDMEIAVNSLKTIGGGITIASRSKLEEYLPLPIAGIITSDDPYTVKDKVKKLNSIARSLGVKDDYDPFITLGFMALPVIPEIKITARGIFDFNTFQFIDLFC